MPFLYAGQYYDKETELAYNRFRYYDPNTGSYISQDPIGLAGNNPTLYGYVFDSNTEVDVFGLSFKSWVVNGEIDYNKILNFVNDKQLNNVFTADLDRYPTGGFKYEYSDKIFNYVIHGHGIDLGAVSKFPNSNSAISPTISISRKPINGGAQQYLMTNISWKKRRTNADMNNSHIPLKNYGCK